MQTVLITGGTGLVGRALTHTLVQKGYRVIILTRDLTGKQAAKNTSYAIWDVKEQRIDIEAIQSADHIIHLAGAGVVDKKWTAEYKSEIVSSRVKSSALLVAALRNNPNKVRAVISTSAIGWYGPDHILPHSQAGFTESDPAHNSFLGETCRLWEQSIEPVEQLGKRLAKLRVGIVLSGDGGALAEFRKPLHFGLATIIGSGKQLVSWIHIDDLCRIFIHAIENENISGSYNAVAPEPVSNKTLILRLAKSVSGSFFIPIHVPGFLLKIMMGQRSIEILKSTTVSCEKIEATGFDFLYPDIGSAIEELTKRK